MKKSIPVSGKPPQDFFRWLFVKRDIDGLVVGLMISSSISYLLRDLTEGIFKPIFLNGMLGGDGKVNFEMFGNKVEIDWKKVVGSIMSLMLNLVLAFFIVRWSLSAFPDSADKKVGKGNKRVAAAAANNRS